MRDYIPKDEYDIGKYRYKELLNYCRQYPEWKRQIADCYGLRPTTPKGSRTGGISDPTERAVEKAERVREKMKLIEQAAIAADDVLYPYIIENVSTGLSYEIMMANGKKPPCGINQFYDLRRKFFWFLDNMKNK